MANNPTALHDTLDQFAAGTLRAEVLCARFRMAALSWPDLPDRYATVLERLLQPLDTATMIGGESCSFSLDEVVEALRQWLDHAARLPGR